MPISDGMVHSANGKLKPKVTMHGHYHLCTFKDGLMDWVMLKELKESNPIEVAKFAVANHLMEEPTYKWWVHKVLWQWNRIISKVKSRYWRMTHKFGICLYMLCGIMDDLPVLISTMLIELCSGKYNLHITFYITI